MHGDDAVKILADKLRHPFVFVPFFAVEEGVQNDHLTSAGTALEKTSAPIIQTQ